VTPGSEAIKTIQYYKLLREEMTLTLPRSRDRNQVLARRERGSTASDQELCALRVELRGVRLVKREGLPSDEIVARQKVRRDDGIPLEVGHKKTVGPLPSVDCATDQTKFVDFELR
jgi:hypothetical protein